MSSGSDLRRRSSSNGRRNTRLPPHPFSPSSRRRTPPNTRRKSEPIDILHKCSSEPFLRGTAFGAGDDGRILLSGGWLYRPMTCTDVFSPSMLSPERIRGSDKVYQEDYKVVVTVTVEGSTGPVRTMVKLGSSVEGTIKLVLDQYSKEGRNPPLDQHAVSQYELHLSYFSFESLDRSCVIGSLKSRNFYLRKFTGIEKPKPKPLASEIASAESTPPRRPCPLMVFLPAYISRNIAIILRRMRKLWKMLGCLHDP